MRIVIQFLLILVGTAFEWMGTGWGHFRPLFFKEDESIRGYIYYNCEHIKFVVMALMMWVVTARKEYYKSDRLFFILMVLDWIDYALFGNLVWFNIGVVPVSMNTVSVVIFFVLTYKLCINSIGNQYFG